MSLWNQLIELQTRIQTLFDLHLNRYDEDHMSRFNQENWINLTWSSNKFRRAHIDVVDAREEKRLWMMHICIFPHVNSGAPIYGFDVISGANKITGAFHDFSPLNPNHDALYYFRSTVSQFQWKKERELPPWAKAIFSNDMVAVGNIQTETELEQLIDLVYKNTVWYLTEMNVSTDMNSVELQNRYAYYQKQNPHTPRTMKALGLNDEDVDFFVSQCLFPEIQTK